MEIKKMVGERLKQARKAKGLTQDVAGQAIGQRYQNYARYENGVFELNYEQMITLCKLFDCTSDYLLGLSDL